MKEVTLEAVVRTDSGKGSARQTRRDGRIPAITYGPDSTPVSCAIDDKFNIRTRMIVNPFILGSFESLITISQSRCKLFRDQHH